MKSLPKRVVEALRPFNPTWRRIFSEALLRAQEGRRVIACFDADGTIWAEDIGEAMLRLLAAAGLLPSEKRPWQEVYGEYEERVRKDRCAGYAWAVEVMAGLREEEVVRWSKAFAASWPNYRPQMVRLLQALEEGHVEVYIISATCEWLVRAAAGLMGIEESRVYGIRSRVQNGVLTSEVLKPITCGPGKVEAIRKYIGQMPDIAVGDSPGDTEMLEAASQALVVARRDRPSSDFVLLARSRSWPLQWF